MTNEVVDMEDGAAAVPARPASSQDRLLAMIQATRPNYHPVLAMVDLAHSTDEDVDSALKFQCHKEVAKYVVAVDKFVDIKSDIRKTQRVVVELFGAPDQPKPALDVGEFQDVESRRVVGTVTGPVDDGDDLVVEASYDPNRSLLHAWADVEKTTTRRETGGRS